MAERAERISGNSVVEVLLRCARAQLRDEDVAVLTPLLGDPSFDWQQLVSVGRRFNILPLLFNSLAAIDLDLVPQEQRHQLREVAEGNNATNEATAAELLRVLDLFEAAEIDTIAFKGPIIAVLAYGDLRLRRYYDLDLLVHRRDVERSQEIFLANGYEPLENYQLGWEWHFVNREMDAFIDLHVTITLPHLPQPLDFEDYWHRLEPVTLMGRQVYSFCLLDTLSILCVQASKDWFQRTNFLPKIIDIHELEQRNPDIDWQDFLNRARAQGIYRSVLLAMQITRRFLAVALPPPVQAAIEADGRIRRLEMPIDFRILAEPNGPFDLDQLTLMRLKMAINDYSVPRYFLSKAFTPGREDKKMVRLPRSLDFLYYLLRPVRLACTACMFLLRAIRVR